MLKWLIFSINVKTDQSKPVKRMARIQSLSGNSSRGHQHMLSESLRREWCTPVSELCYYSTCCFCWPRLTLQSPASHRSHARLCLHSYTTALQTAEASTPDRTAACQSWICFPLLQVMCLWYMCFCAEVFFILFSDCTPQWSIVWGLHFFFSSLSSCNAVIFFNSLSSCPVYPLYVCYVWAGWWLISLVLVTKWQ